MVNEKKTLRVHIDANSNGVLSSKEITDFLVSEFGKDWVFMENDTMFQEWEGRFIPEDGYDYIRNKINALKTLYLSNSFYEDHLVFEKIISAICEIEISWEDDQEPDVSEINFAFKDIEEIMSLDKEFFCSEIRGYVAGIAQLEGMILLPERLSFAQNYLDRLNKETFLNFFEGEEREKAKNSPESYLLYLKNTIRSKSDNFSSLEMLDEENLFDNQAIKLKRIYLFEKAKRRSK